MKLKIVIVILIIAVVLSGIGYIAIKASDLKLPSHSDFQRRHSGGNAQADRY